MRFVLVYGRTPRPRSLCVECSQPIGESYLREFERRRSTAIMNATRFTVNRLPHRSKTRASIVNISTK